MTSGQVSPTSPTILDAAGHIGVDLNCFNCGYNLRTLPVTGNCPECGHPVAETAMGYLPHLDRLGRIAIDLPCVGCGYNLRMQPATGICPECATPVARSARGHYLHQAPTRWVKRLASGALLVTIAVCGGVGLSIVSVVATSIAAAVGVIPEEIFELLLPLLMIVTGVVGLWFVIRGLVLLTTPDPTARFRREGSSARKLVRYCLIALPVLILTSVTVASLRFWASPLGLSSMFSPVLIVLGALAGFAYFVLPLATLRHIATLMRRIPRRGWSSSPRSSSGAC